MNTNHQQQAGRRLNWARITGMGSAGALHLAAFMLVLAPSAPVEGPPPKDPPIVAVDIVKPKPPLDVPMPKAPPRAQPRTQPRPQPPLQQREVVIDMPPVALDQPYEMAVPVAETPMPTPAPTPMAQVADSGPSVQQSYGEIAAIPYPIRGRKQQLEGKVMLRVLVSENGDPLKVEVETSSGHRVLDMAALKGVKKWKFNPGYKSGQPIQGWVLVPINFSLNQVKG